jgi:excisionase family DNA binding protein
MLNTKEAARFLRASEASIRRWSDAGLLPAKRIGRRRERRFSESDLTAFLGGSAGDAQPAQRQKPSAVNAGGIPLPVHAHLATFYDSDAGRVRITVPFLAEGLRSGQPCFLAASGAVLDAYLRALDSEPGVDARKALESRLLVTVGGPGPSVDGALRYWEEAMGRAVSGGPTILRVVGEMTCEREVFASVAEMMRYEVAFNTIAARFPSVTLCAYDVREFDGQTIFDAMRSHPDLFDLRIGSFLN